MTWLCSIASKNKKAYITQRSRVVPLHSTNQAQAGLISEFWSIAADMNVSYHGEDNLGLIYP
jgi:hypothetical protein